MKTKLFYSILAILLYYQNISAQTFQIKNTVGKAFVVEPGANLLINNKYGDITIQTHSGNELRIDALITVKSDDSLQTKLMLDYIEIDMTKNGGYVKAETKITQSNTIIDLFKILEQGGMTFQNIQVDYTVNMPSYVSINISNNYGDIYVGNLTSEANIQLKNGSLLFDKLMANSNSIYVINGKIQGNEIKKAALNIQFCQNVKITKAGELKVESLSSQYQIDEIDKLTIQSRRDKWFISSNKELFGSSFMSDFQVDLLEERISLMANYGILEIKDLKNTFSLINLNSNYTKIDLFIPYESSFAFDFSGENAELLNPFEQKSLTENLVDKSRKIVEIKGNVGIPGTKSLLKIVAKNASVNLYYN